MPRFIIRYDAKPEGSAENTKLVEGVFRELKATAPKGVSYAVLRSGDTFFHMVAYENEADNEQLTDLPAFKAFVNGGESRRATPPDRKELTIVGNYGMLVE